MSMNREAALIAGLRWLMAPLIFLGLLLAGLDLPLIVGTVAPNSIYGIRTAHAFASEASWYEVNRIGGCVLFGLGSISVLLGIVGLVVPRRALMLYTVVSIALLIALFAGSIGAILRL